jgi:hypothetical protein
MDLTNLETFSGVGLVILVGFACGLISSGISYLREKNRALRERTKSSKYHSAFVVISEIVDDALEAVGTVLIDEIKEASKDGKLTKEEIEGIIVNVATHVNKLVSDKLKVELSEIIDDWDEWLQTRIRATINKMIK